MEAYSLFELNEHVRRVIALNFQEPVWVRCEIAQVKSSRGHYYLDLVEKVPDRDEILAQISAVIWSRNAALIERKLKHVFREILQEGMDVRLRVRVDFHERYGLKLMIEEIDPSFTLGSIETRRREIIEQLHHAGLIGRNSHVPLPPVPQRIAVLSAAHAAGYLDFRKHLLHNPWSYRFIPDLYEIAVQGAMVERQLLQALEDIRRVSHHYDCVVLIRGGGARLDLAAFDSYAIGSAIAEFPLPVLTGIGHEIDHTVADAVAHTALKTPTAVADFLIGQCGTFDRSIHTLYQNIQQVIDRRLRSEVNALRHQTEMIRKAPGEGLLRRKMHIRELFNQLQRHAVFSMQKHKDRLEHLDVFLESLDPVSLLRRGFSITIHNGNRISSVQQVSDGERITTILADGQLDSITTSS